MEDSIGVMEDQKSVTVNFENLHANMALGNPQGDARELKPDDKMEKDVYEKENQNGNIADGETDTINSKNEEEKSNEAEIKANGFEEVSKTDDGTTAVKYTAEETTTSIEDVLKLPHGDGDLAEKLAEKVKENEPPSGETESDIQDVAKEIIKKAVDGAAEQILQEKSDDEIEQKEKEEEWMDVLGNGLLKKKILQKGEGPDTRPMRENEVTIKYKARLKNGEEIVESSDSLTFILAEQDVLPVFDLAVALMQKGEIAEVESSARYAHGEEGNPPKIPPNSDMMFEIELLEVGDGPFSENMDLDKRLSWADEKRQKGNKFYSGKKNAEAAAAYTRAIKALEKGWLFEESDEARRRINEMRLKCYNNLTATQMKLEKWKDAFHTCRAAEKLDPNNVKTMFRKGRIHCELGELDKGVPALSKAAKLEPDNKTIANELAKQTRKLEKQKESQKKMYRRMLGTKSDVSTSPTKKSKETQKSWFQSWGRVVGGTLAVGAVLVGMYIAQKSLI